MKSKKRGAVFAVVSLMMCVAVYLNWSYGKENNELVIGDMDTSKILGEAQYVDGVNQQNNDGEAENTGLFESDYFSEARLTRQQARDEAISILKETVESKNSTESAKEQASSQISLIAENAVKESRIENLVRAKGYDECIAIIDDDGISVVVSATVSGMTVEDAAKIKDIASSETKLKSDKIKIIETSKK